jgi:hypothetical protein
METTIMSEERFDRIEGKIDKLVEAVLTMAHLHGAVERVEERVDKLELDVHEIEKKMPLVDVMLKTVGKVGGAILILIVGGAVGSYFVF